MRSPGRVAWPTILGALACSTAHGQVDVPALVRDMRSKEQWIHRVDSIHLKISGRWTATRDTVERRWQALSLRLPVLEQPAPADYPELRRYIPEELEIAFDDSRMYFRSYWLDARFNLRYWDGDQLTAFGGRTPEEITHYALGLEPGEMLGSIILEPLSWLHGTFHSFWWDRFEPQPRTDIILGEAEEFTSLGTIKYRGAPCHVLESRGGFLRWYVGVDDHQLRGYVRRVLNPGIDVMPVIEDIGRQEGRAFQRERDYVQWKFAQPPEKRRRLDAMYYGRLLEHTRPEVELYMDDFEEVSEGWWYPMVQGFDVFETEPDEDGTYAVATKRVLNTKEIAINAPLPDSMFEHEMIEGVEVNDWRYQPMIIYPYRRGMTAPEELQVLAKLNEDPLRYAAAQKSRDELIGSFPPAFPETTWYNSEPLTWAQLKGKAVIIAFWAGWYEPCYDEILQIRDMHELTGETGIIVIGIHPPGSEEAYMRRTIKRFRTNMPICMDTKQPGSVRGWGTLFNQFRVEGIPHAFLIDAGGRIVGHGSMNDVVALAQDLRFIRR